MDSITIDGNGKSNLPIERYDMHRRGVQKPPGVCHAPWVSLHISAQGAATPCRYDGSAIKGQPP